MKPKAYPYIRFSTSIQEKGDSIRRQTEKAVKFAKDHKLDLDTSLELHDLGVSAYKGGNLEQGSLKRFIDLVENGTIATGSYLLIENFDRFSRMNPRKAISPFLNLTNAGINVAVIDDNRVHSDRDGSIELMATILSMERAHQESERKSKNVRSAKYKAKQQILDGERKTLWKWGTPKWLDISEDGSEYIVNEERVKVINDILDWVIEGRGTGWIIDKLNERGVQPWESGSGIRVTKKKPKHWYNSQITRIVNNRALIGERELIVTDEDGENERIEIIENHFPAVVDPDKFKAAEISRKSRDLNRDEEGKLKAGAQNRGGGRKGKTITNLFQKLAVCGYSVEGNMSKFRCPDSNRFMVYANKDRKDDTGKVHRLRYLQCSASREKGSPCKDCKKLYRYEDFETAFLTHVRGVPVETIFGTNENLTSEVGKINQEITVLQDQLRVANNQVAKYKDAMERSDSISDTLLTQLLKYEAQQKEIPKKIKTLQSKRRSMNAQHEQGGAIKKELIHLIDEMEKCKDDKELFELRFKVSSLLKGVIDTIEVYNRGNFIDAGVMSQKIERLREKMTGKVSEEEMGLMIESLVANAKEQYGQEDKQPYFVVRYRSGERKMIAHHPDDPTKLMIGMEWDDAGLSEKPYFRDQNGEGNKFD